MVDLQRIEMVDGVEPRHFYPHMQHISLGARSLSQDSIVNKLQYTVVALGDMAFPEWNLNKKSSLPNMEQNYFTGTFRIESQQVKYSMWPYPELQHVDIKKTSYNNIIILGNKPWCQPFPYPYNFTKHRGETINNLDSLLVTFTRHHKAILIICHHMT